LVAPVSMNWNRPAERSVAGPGGVQVAEAARLELANPSNSAPEERTF